MLRTRRLLCGCLVLILACCLVLSASLAIAGMSFERGLLIHPKHATLLDLGDVWIGDPCRRIQEIGLPIGCFGYRIAVVVKKAGQDYTIVSLPYPQRGSP